MCEVNKSGVPSLWKCFLVSGRSDLLSKKKRRESRSVQRKVYFIKSSFILLSLFLSPKATLHPNAREGEGGMSGVRVSANNALAAPCRFMLTVQALSTRQLRFPFLRFIFFVLRFVLASCSCVQPPPAPCVHETHQDLCMWRRMDLPLSAPQREQ